jgi:CheY-like chemotaxis protein
MHKLLLADDSVTIQRVIELTFSGEDVQVLAVNDGEQAIARIPLERPDVVLADIGMPRKGGYDVSAFVKGRADLAHIPVLLLAGAFEPVDQARAEQVKADGVLIKPFEPRQVIERVKELLAVVPQPAAVALVDVPVSEPSPQAPEPEPAAAPAAETTANGGAEPVQSLDELFESLNQAMFEPVAASPAATSEPRPPSPLEASFEPEPFIVEPPLAFESMRTPAGNGSTLEDYFDRLSAAFEQAGAPTARPFQPMPERLEELEPPAREAAAAAPARPADEWPAEEWLSPAATTLPFERRGDAANPILEAVTALMAQGSENGSAKDAPPAWPATTDVSQAAPRAASPTTVDAVAERVLARLVPEVAERLRELVREELARGQHDVH